MIQALRHMEITKQKNSRNSSLPPRAQIKRRSHKKNGLNKSKIVLENHKNLMHKLITLIMTIFSTFSFSNVINEITKNSAIFKGKKLKAVVELSKKLNLPLKQKLMQLKMGRRKKKKLPSLWVTKETNSTQPLFLGQEINNINRDLKHQLFTPICFGEINGLKSYVQLDSGATANLIGKDLALDLIKRNLVNSIHNKQKTVLFDVQHRIINQPLNPIDISVMFGSTPVKICFNVVDNLQFPLLGAGTMINSNMSIINNNNSSCLLIGDPLKPDVIVKNSTSFPTDVLLLNDESFKSGINKVTCYSCLDEGTVEISGAENFIDTCLFIPQQSIEIKNHKSELQIYNLSENKFDLNEDTTMGSLTQIGNYGDEIEDNSQDDAEDESEDSRFQFPLSESQGNKLLDSTEPFSFAIDEEIIDWKTEFSKDGVFPDELREEFMQFIEIETPNIFSKTEYDCGCLDKKYGYIEDFPLTDNIPITSKPYRLNSVRAAQVQSTFDRLEKNGLMIRGLSEYATPCLLVPKSDGRLRLCLDYRLLNSKCESTNQPIPRIDALLQMISDSRPSIFSTCDISNAFHSLTLSRKAMLKASVVTTTSQYLPTRLIFGYKNAPALFILALQKVFEELPKDDNNIPYCTFYFDDIVVFSKNKEDHIRHLKNVFILLHKVGLKIQSTKNKFFKPRIELLGKVITGTTISPQKKHVQSLIKFPQPTNLKQLQSFLGITAWNANLICDYTRTISPLTKLLRKNEPFIWEQDQTNAFNYIKALLTEFTIQYFVDYSLPLYLACDASDRFVAGILYQIKSYTKEEIPKLIESLKYTKELHKLPPPKHPPEHPLLPKGALGIPSPFKLTKEGVESPHDLTKLSKNAQSETFNEDSSDNLEEFIGSKDKLHIICNVGYFSSSLSKSQAAYSIIEKEAFAVVSALEFFKPLLHEANNIYILSDSRPFLFIMKLMRFGLSRLQRWSIRLFSLPYTIIMCHVAGVYNYSDCLTRVWAVVDDPESKPDMKKAIIVESPFKIGQLITLNDLSDALEKQPNLVTFTPKIPYTRFQKTSDIKFVGSNLISEVEKMTTITEIMKEQRSDNYCSQLTENEKFYKHKGIWYKRHKEQKDADDTGRIVVPRSLVSPVIAMFHIENHCGVTNLHSHLKVNYFFPNMFSTIRQFVQLCHLCAVYKASTSPKIPVGLRDLDPAPKNSIYSLDIVEGLPSFKNSGSYLSIVEYYSGYRIIVPLKYSTSKEIAGIIEKDIICTFGPPLLIISDNGTNLLKSKNVKKLCNFYGIQTHLTSPYHASSHGRIEVSHQSITTLLKICSENLSKPWYELCSFVQLALNSRPSTTLGGLTPMYVMFGSSQEYRRKKNIKLSDVPNPSEMKNIWNTHDKVCDQIIREYNIQRNKMNIKKGGKMVNYEIGSYIWAKNFKKSPKMKSSTKFLSPPLEVVKDYGHAILARNSYGIIFKLHKNNVKPCPAQNLELYNALPLKTKLCLGAEFNESDLHKYYNELSKDEEEQVTKGTEENLTTTESVQPTDKEEEFDPFFDDELSEEDSEEELETEIPLSTQNFKKPSPKKSPRHPDQPIHMKLRKRVRFKKD